jgi:hypothetical protein
MPDSRTKMAAPMPPPSPAPAAASSSAKPPVSHGVPHRRSVRRPPAGASILVATTLQLLRPRDNRQRSRDDCLATGATGAVAPHPGGRKGRRHQQEGHSQ